jgi:hypothetical protein
MRSERARAMAVFGRKKVHNPAPEPNPRDQPGHRHVLDHVRREEAKGDMLVRPALAAQALFDDLYFRMATPEKGTRIEDMLAVLGACGGFACIVGVLHGLRLSGRTPRDIELMVLEGKDGHTYYFGDAPNSLLLESQHSLLSLTLGAAQSCGAPVTLDRVHAVMKHVAQTVGSPEFGSSRIAQPHTPALPLRRAIELVWPSVAAALDVYEVAPARRPTTIGFAIQKAIDTGKSVLDPLIAADIVTDAAVPAAKLNPADFGVRP